MTATEALGDTGVRGAVVLATHSSDRTVCDVLRGYKARAVLQKAILAELERGGVDLATIPALEAEELAEHKAKRKPPCRRCVQKDIEIAALKRKLEAQHQPPSPPKLGVVPAAG